MTDPLQFTGERYIPGAGGAQIAYEHLHRYLFALNWAQGKRVLDIGSGAGYGAALLSSRATAVWGLDISGSAAGFARKNFGRDNLIFITADAAFLPFRSRSMQLVVAMETLEHVGNPEAFVAELERVCTQEGVVLLSTPDKSVYSDSRNYSNPYHVHEFYPEELLTLLRRYFEKIHLMNQQVRAGSFISDSSSQGAGFEILTEPAPASGRPIAEPMYLLAVCSNGAEEIAVARRSIYLDLTDSLFQEWCSEMREAGEEVARLNEEIRRLGAWGRKLEEEVNSRDESIQVLHNRMKGEIARRDVRYQALASEFDARGKWGLRLQDEVANRDLEIRRVGVELERRTKELRETEERLAHIRSTFLYRALAKVGILPR